MNVSVTYVDINPEVKIDTTAMIVALNEACIEWLHENCYLMRGTFLAREMNNFLAVGWFSAAIPLISYKGFGEGADSPHLGVTKQD